MIRTRDFLLYVLVLVFLALAIGTTVVINRSDVQVVSQPVPAFGESTEPKAAADISSEGENALNRLRTKIAAGEGQILSAPPVMTSVDTPTEPLVEVSVVNYCNMVAPHPVTKAWPETVMVRETASMYQVIGETELTVPNGSSTNIVIEEFPFQLIPKNSERGSYDTCLPDTTIGVDINGQPLDNRNVDRYRAFDYSDLIGYARDGIPIYGTAPVEAQLDVCGGMDTSSGYSYFIQPESEGIISCYAQIPTVFKE